MEDIKPTERRVEDLTEFCLNLYLQGDRGVDNNVVGGPVSVILHVT